LQRCAAVSLYRTILKGKTMQVAASVFKAYDIRGVVPVGLNESVAEGLGKAFGTAAMAAGNARWPWGVTAV
jgi:phosphomannomutase